MDNGDTADTEVSKPLLDEEETKYGSGSSTENIIEIDNKHVFDADDSNYKLDRKLRTEQELEYFLESSMIVLSDFDALRIYITTPISKLYNIAFIIFNMYQFIHEIDSFNDLTYLEMGSQLIITVEFVGLIIILLTALIMYAKGNIVTFIDSVQLSGSFSTFQLFYQCRPRAIIRYLSTVYKNNNALHTNIKNCEIWRQMMAEDSAEKQTKNKDIKYKLEIDHYLDTFKKQLQTENINMFMTESAYGLIILFIFGGLALGLLSLILKLSQLKFIINGGDIIDWSGWDWFACIGFANQLWNMVNINQIKAFAVYDLIFTNTQNISRFTKSKMNRMMYLDSIIKTKLMQRFKWKGTLIAISLKYKHILQFLIKNPYEHKSLLKVSMDATVHAQTSQSGSYLSKWTLQNKVKIDAVAEAKLFCENQKDLQAIPQRKYKINDHFPNFSFIFERIERRLIQFFGIIAILSIITCLVISLMSVLMFQDDLDIHDSCDHEIYAISIVITMILLVGSLIVIYLHKKTGKNKQNKNVWYVRGFKLMIALLSVIIITSFSVFVSQDCMKHINESRYYRIEYVAILVNLCLLILFISPILIHALFNPNKIIAVISAVTIVSDAFVSVAIILFLITYFIYGIETYDYFVFGIGAIFIYYILNGFYFVYKCIRTENYLSYICNLEWHQSLQSHKYIKIATLAGCISLMTLVIRNNESNIEYTYDWIETFLFYSTLIYCSSWFFIIIVRQVIFEKSVDFIMYHYWFTIAILFIYSVSDIVVYVLSVVLVSNYYIFQNHFMYQNIDVWYFRLITLVMIVFSMNLFITAIKRKCCQFDILNKIEGCCSIVLDVIYLFIAGFVINDYEIMIQTYKQHFELMCFIILIFIVLIGQILAVVLKCLQRKNVDMKFMDAVNHPWGPFTVLKWFKILP